MDIEKVKVCVTMATSWHRAKEKALMTSGKTIVNEPDEEWKRKMLLCEHSPIRMVEYDFVIENVPQWVTVHLVRHFIGVEKFVCSQREDRNPDVIDRDSLPQGALNKMSFVANAQALINISKLRLCYCASKETRQVWEKMKAAIAEIDPMMAKFMQPSCVYRGFCPEIKSCGLVNTDKWREMRDNYKETVTKNNHE